MPKIMKKDLHTETPTVNISIFSVVCLPVMVKKRRMTTMKPKKYDRSFCQRSREIEGGQVMGMKDGLWTVDNLPAEWSAV